jgi:hypothetical protein
MFNNEVEPISRRKFLQAIGIGGLAMASGAGDYLLGSSDIAFPNQDDLESLLATESLTFEKARDLAIRFDKLYDQLPDLGIEINPETTSNWILEVTPFFVENKITTRATVPSKVLIANFDEASAALHTMGASDCKDTLVINARVENPLSSWYKMLDFWGLVVHELAHLQQGQICFDSGAVQPKEKSAQIAMIEVLSSMALDGNKIALFSLINELRTMSFGSAWYLAATKGRKAELKQLADKIFADPISQGQWRRMNISWKGRESDLFYNLASYSLLPLEAAMKAVKTGEPVQDLQFPVSTLEMDDFSAIMETGFLEKLVAQHAASKK